jgi:hypothetical protein
MQVALRKRDLYIRFAQGLLMYAFARLFGRSRPLCRLARARDSATLRSAISSQRTER